MVNRASAMGETVVPFNELVETTAIDETNAGIIVRAKIPNRSSENRDSVLVPLGELGSTVPIAGSAA